MHGAPSQGHGTDNEMIVRQLWEELPDAEVGEMSQSFEGRRSKKGLRNGDVRVKLERSRQSARECRARNELMIYVSWCKELDMGRIPEGFDGFLKGSMEK